MTGYTIHLGMLDMCIINSLTHEDISSWMRITVRPAVACSCEGFFVLFCFFSLSWYILGMYGRRVLRLYGRRSNLKKERKSNRLNTIFYRGKRVGAFTSGWDLLW